MITLRPATVEDDDAMAPVKRITPEIGFPESQGGAQVYGTAWPLSEDYYLSVYDVTMQAGVGFQGGADLRGNYGIYLVDAFGNKELIYRNPEIACQSPVPLRSSPMMEDGQFSFAGQYATFLNVSHQEVGQKYKEIAASQFSSRALSYMKNRGLIEEDITMGVLCQKLIRARVSGVLFTTHWDPDHGETVMVNAVWGMGKFVVDGTISPDLYILDKRICRLMKQESLRLQAKS